MEILKGLDKVKADAERITLKRIRDFQEENALKAEEEESKAKAVKKPVVEVVEEVQDEEPVVEEAEEVLETEEEVEEVVEKPKAKAKKGSK